MYDQWVGKTLLNCLRNAAAGWYRRSRPSRASAAFAFSPPPELVGVAVELMISAPRRPARLVRCSDRPRRRNPRRSPYWEDGASGPVAAPEIGRAWSVARNWDWWHEHRI